MLGKAHQKWWYETEIGKFYSKGDSSFRRDGESRKTSFERNWTTFVNPPFFAAWKSPPKMVVWNKPRGIRSQGCFFVSPRWGKTKKRVFNAIGRTLSTPLFARLAKAHQKWWYETDLVEFDPKGVFSFGNDGESRKNEFSTQLDDLRQPGFLQCLQKPGKNGGMKPKLVNSIPRVILRFAVMGKVEKTSFERNWTNFVNPAFCAACKSPPKMVVWNRPRGIRSQGCFFVWQRWGKSKKWVFNAIGRPSSTRLFAVLAKARQKWWYETEIGKFDSKGDSSFRRDGESRKNEFWTELDDLVNPAFYAACKSPPKMVVWNRPRGIWSQGFLFVSPRWGKSKKRPSSTRLFALLVKASPPKMVVWNWPCGIWSQGCFFVSPRWGNSKKRVLNAIGRPSSTRHFTLLAKAHPKWWYETDLVEFDPKGIFSFRPDMETRKHEFWTQLDHLR